MLFLDGKEVILDMFVMMKMLKNIIIMFKYKIMEMILKFILGLAVFGMFNMNLYHLNNVYLEDQILN